MRLHQVFKNSAVHFFFVDVVAIYQHMCRKYWKSEKFILSSPFFLSLSNAFHIKENKKTFDICTDRSGVNFIVYSAFLRHAPIYAAFLLLSERIQKCEDFVASRYPRENWFIPSRPRIPSTNAMSTSFSQRDININVLRKVYSNNARCLWQFWQLFLAARRNTLHRHYDFIRNFR